MKLSSKQKDVIQKMREGADASWNLSTSSGGYYKLGDYFINGNTIKSLHSKGLIEDKIRKYNQHLYQLTKLGKSITL